MPAERLVADRDLEAEARAEAARVAFEQLGASPWAERAAALASSPPAESADALFVSPKTIDFHLRNIYRKLGLRSRTDLAALVAQSA